MSRGGFKAFCVDVNGISGGGTISDVENVISQITQGIVNTSQGWNFDTGKTPSKTEFINVGDNGRAQFLTHTNGAKLCVAICISGGTKCAFDFKSCFNPEKTTTNDGVMSGGLCMSMIPPNMGDFNTDNITTASFMPNTALRLVGFGMSYSASYYPKCFVERSDMDNRVYRYMIIVRDDVIMATSRLLDAISACTFYAIGNMITCTHDGDNNTFATFLPYNRYSSTSEGDNTTSYLNNTSDSSTNITVEPYGNAQFYAKDGGLLSAGSSYNDSGSTAHNATAIITRNVSITQSFGSNYRRFVPFNVYMSASGTPYSGGVVPYDYYKGIINPEVMCQIYHTSDTGLSLGALLDNGNYLHLCNGIIVGWDASNTAKFWG